MLFVSAVLWTAASALQKTVYNGAARTKYGRQTAENRICQSDFTYSALSHRRRPLSHAVAAATPRSQRLRLAAAPDAEPDAAATDGGVFGAGIYVTPHAEYACKYSVVGRAANDEGLYPVLLCMVLLGNTYPITRSADYSYPEIMSEDSVSVFHYLDPIPFDENSGKFHRTQARRSDKVLKARYDSHYVSVKESIDFQAVDDNSYDYDEIVVKSEHQVLPIAIAYVKPRSPTKKRGSARAGAKRSVDARRSAATTVYAQAVEVEGEGAG